MHTLARTLAAHCNTFHTQTHTHTIITYFAFFVGESEAELRAVRDAVLGGERESVGLRVALGVFEELRVGVGDRVELRVGVGDRELERDGEDACVGVTSADSDDDGVATADTEGTGGAGEALGDDDCESLGVVVAAAEEEPLGEPVVLEAGVPVVERDGRGALCEAVALALSDTLRVGEALSVFDEEPLALELELEVGDPLRVRVRVRVEVALRVAENDDVAESLGVDGGEAERVPEGVPGGLSEGGAEPDAVFAKDGDGEADDERDREGVEVPLLLELELAGTLLEADPDRVPTALAEAGREGVAVPLLELAGTLLEAEPDRVPTALGEADEGNEGVQEAVPLLVTVIEMEPVRVGVADPLPAAECDGVAVEMEDPPPAPSHENVTVCAGVPARLVDAITLPDAFSSASVAPDNAAPTAVEFGDHTLNTCT